MLVSVSGFRFINDMEPYRITRVVFVSYSGKRVSVTLETEVFTKPLHFVKEKILDGFVAMCKQSDDPIVKIEKVVVVPVFKSV